MKHTHLVTAELEAQPTLYDLEELSDESGAPKTATVNAYPVTPAEPGEPKTWRVELTW